jgi:uncharacterized protein
MTFPEDKLLQEIIDRIVEAIEPERVILFGSACRGEMNRNSDIDLLVIKSDVHRGKATDAIYRRMRGSGYPVDIIVTHPEDLQQFGDSPAMVFSAAIRNGRDVYVA